MDYAQLVKLYGPSSQEEQRRYSPTYCLGSKKVAVMGDPRHEDISTSYVERHNLTMRIGHRDAILARAKGLRPERSGAGLSVDGRRRHGGS